MYIVFDNLPKDCFECKYRTKCEVWEKFLSLSINEAEIQMENMNLLKPRIFNCCKIYPLPNIISRIYLKWIRGLCRHNCYFCTHKNRCEIYLDGRE